MEDIEESLAKLIIEVLNLRISADSIEPEHPLFDSGLGLDSIDALEIAVAVEAQYGVKIRANDKNNINILHSLRSLAQFIASETKTS